MDKPGFKTTEFWLTLAAMLVLCAAVLAGLGYTVTRGAVKKASKPPE
jgi:hypothetical protein